MKNLEKNKKHSIVSLEGHILSTQVSRLPSGSTNIRCVDVK